jgi:hypothetical protein
MPTSTQSKIVHRKPRERPPVTNYSEIMLARLEPETVVDIDMWATANGVSRSRGLRRLVELGLKAEQMTEAGRIAKLI